MAWDQVCSASIAQRSQIGFMTLLLHALSSCTKGGEGESQLVASGLHVYTSRTRYSLFFFFVYTKLHMSCAELGR